MTRRDPPPAGARAAGKGEGSHGCATDCSNEQRTGARSAEAAGHGDYGRRAPYRNSYRSRGGYSPRFGVLRVRATRTLTTPRCPRSSCPSGCHRSTGDSACRHRYSAATGHHRRRRSRRLRRRVTCGGRRRDERTVGRRRSHQSRRGHRDRSVLGLELLELHHDLGGLRLGVRRRPTCLLGVDDAPELEEKRVLPASSTACPRSWPGPPWLPLAPSPPARSLAPSPCP